MTNLSRPWPIIIIGTTIVVSLFTYVFSGSALRPLLMLWFLLICPGMAWVRLIRLGDAIVELALALGLSISIDAMITFVFLYSKAWSSDGIFITLLIISFTGAVVQLASRSSVFSFFNRYSNMRQAITTSLATVSSFTQQETQSSPLPSITQQKEAARLDEIHTQMLAVQAPSLLRRSLQKIRIFSVSSTLTLPFDEATPEEPTSSDMPICDKDKNISLISDTPVAAPKHRDPEGSTQPPRTPHPILVEPDENMQDLDVDENTQELAVFDDDETITIPRVVVTPKSEKKEK